MHRPGGDWGRAAPVVRFQHAERRNILLDVSGHAFHEKGLTKTKRGRSTVQQKGTESGFRLAGKPDLNRTSAIRQRKVVSWASRSVGFLPCPAQPCRPAVLCPDPTRLFLVSTGRYTETFGQCVFMKECSERLYLILSGT